VGKLIVAPEEVMIWRASRLMDDSARAAPMICSSKSLGTKKFPAAPDARESSRSSAASSSLRADFAVA
jgi:hypothetical protein